MDNGWTCISLKLGYVIIWPMRKLKRLRDVYPLLLIAAIALSGAGTPHGEQIQRYRNLGKAFYENPTTHAEAIAEFKKALDLAPASVPEKLNYGLALLHGGRVADGIAALQDVQRRDPSLPHTWFNLGIYYRKSGDIAKAATQFEQMLKLVPDEPIGHYQLGAVERAAGKNAEAIAQFEEASRLNQLLAAAHFQLYNLYRQTGRAEDAAKQLATFQELKKQQEGAAVPEDVDWCTYAEIYDPPRRVTAPASSPQTQFDDRILEGTVDPLTAGMLAIDSEGTGQTDLLVWSARGVRLYRRGSQFVQDTGFAGVAGVISVAAGDYDNDGLMDLCILTDAGPLLYRNTKGRFARVDANLPKRRFETRRLDRLRSRLRSGSGSVGRVASAYAQSGQRRVRGSHLRFPVRQGHPRSACKLRVDPDSKAFDLAVYYPISARGCSLSRSAWRAIS